MDHSRSALVVYRVIIGLLGILYGVYKFVRQDLNPLMFNPPPEIESTLPWAANPVLARMAAVTAITIAAYIVLSSVILFIYERKNYSVTLPTTPWHVQLAMLAAAFIYSYYALLAVLSGAVWFYVVTLAFISITLSIYEHGQSRGTYVA